MRQEMHQAPDALPARRPDPPTQSLWTGLRNLRAPVRATALVLLACAAAPPAALLGASLSGSSVMALIATHLGLVNLIACGFGVTAVIAFECPRSASPVAYARQLRARFLELQSTFDADDRRRPREGKEKEDDRVSSEP
jgi:hypothetical protein